MINLLPPQIQKNIFYGRRNTAMVHWATALALFITGVLLITMGGQWYMRRTINTNIDKIASARESLKLQNLEQNQKRIEDISNNIKLVVQVLSKEVLFSKLLRQLGSVIPQNATLSQLQIDKVQGGLTINAKATDIQAATQLQLNLQDPANKIFEKADIENITCGTSDPKVKYPCAVQIRALFAKDNPFLLINNKASSKTKGDGQ